MSELRSRNKTALEKNILSEKIVKKTDNSNVPKTSSLTPRIIARVVVIFSLLIIVFITSKKQDEKLSALAKQTEKLSGISQMVQCADDYISELSQFEGCVPRKCGRYVTDQVISEGEADELLKIAKKVLKIAGSNGGASIFDLHSGALSKGSKFINIYKLKDANNLLTEKDFHTYKVVKEKVKYALSLHFNIDPEKIYLTYPTFFSRLTSKNATTDHDQYWHPHIDKEQYKSFHFTTLLYLNDYDIDFYGGRFVFIDNKLNRTVEPRKARLSMFTSGSENQHFVERVTKGIRYAITIPFSCDKMFVIDTPNVNKYS